MIQQIQRNPDKLKAGIILLSKIAKYARSQFQRRAKRTFREIWESNEFGFSTDTQFVNEFLTDVKLPDERWEKLYQKISEPTKYLMLFGLRISSLIDRGMHAEAEKLKEEINSSDGKRGITIINIITTKDIEIFLTKVDRIKSKDIPKEFNKFIRNYDKFSLLVSPKKIKNDDEIKEKIRNLSISKDFLIVNMCGKLEQCLQLLTIIDDLKKELKFEYSQDIGDSGFRKYIKLELSF